MDLRKIMAFRKIRNNKYMEIINKQDENFNFNFLLKFISKISKFNQKIQVLRSTLTSLCANYFLVKTLRDIITFNN